MTKYILKDGCLYHYGIKGQKHGVRNYQYEDGSLTPEGKIRYADSKPRNRPRHIAENVVVSKIEKKDTVNISGNADKPRNRPKHINEDANVADIEKKEIISLNNSQATVSGKKFVDNLLKRAQRKIFIKN